MNAEVAQLPALNRMSAGLRPLLLLVGIAAAVAAGVSIVLWSQGPSYSVLYTGLPPEVIVEVTQTLDAAGIKHKSDAAGGSVSVEADAVNNARLALAAQGVPGKESGFESMAKDSGFGVSQFMEGARYQHALETELARTISSLQPVSSARVHIAAARQSAFVRDRHPATASVFVQLRPGRRLETEQVTAIVNLVASSIAELDPSAVTVVDQAGRLLSSKPGDSDFAMREKQFEFARRIEEEYTQRIVELLTPLVGSGRVRAQVVAQVDMSVTEQAREQYAPDSQVVRSEQLSEQTSRTGAVSGGIPGALSNQPPEPGVALPPGVAQADAQAETAAAGTQAPPANTSRQQTRNYEIDRTLAYTRQPAGRLQRLTVAVLVDNVHASGKGDAAATGTPLADEQLARITTLVKDAVGFDADRGDSVNVINAPFTNPPAAEIPEIESAPLWRQPWVRDLARVIAGAAIVIVLLLMVVRPLLRNLLGPKLLPAAPAGAGGVPVDGELQPETVAAPVALAYEQQVAQARSLVAQDPKRVAKVVKTWVATDE